MEKELSQVSFVGIYRATTLPHNFWVATLLWGYSCKAFITKKTKKQNKNGNNSKKDKQRFSTKKIDQQTCSKSTRKNLRHLEIKSDIV